MLFCVIVMTVIVKCSAKDFADDQISNSRKILVQNVIQ